MPSDIRSFFGKAPPKKKTSSSKASSGTTTAPATTAITRRGVAHAAKDDDSDKKKRGATTTTTTTTTRTTQNGKKSVIDIDSNDDDDDDDETEEEKKPKAFSPTATRNNNTKKRKSNDSKTSHDREEISASDYFAKTMSSSSSSSSKKSSKKAPPASSSSLADLSASPKNSERASDSMSLDNNNNNNNRREVMDLVDSDDDDDDGGDDFVRVEEKPSPPKKQRRSPSPSSNKKVSPPAGASSTGTAPSSSDNKKIKSNSTNTTPKNRKEYRSRSPPLKQTRTCEYFDVHNAAPECLLGYTFVLTGVLPDGGSRDDVTDWIKMMGGRVTTGAVSSKTDYLVILGDQLEDGRPYTEGAKYKKAISVHSDTCQIIHGKPALFGLMQQYCEKKQDDQTRSTAPAAPKPPPTAVPSNPYAKKELTSNTYPKKVSGNPYATKSAKPAATTSAGGNLKRAPDDKAADDAGKLWVDRYKPETSDDILGNGELVKKLKVWLARWEDRFNKDSEVGKAYNNPNGPWKAALLSGPPGIGKTTTATLVAKESGREVVEYNASDVRSKKALQDSLGDITGSRSIQFTAQATKNTKRCIIMDEVDGMGAGDRSGISELIQMIKNSRVPIICICNDRQAQKLKSLIPYCMDMKYRRPTKSQIAKRAVEVGRQEGIAVEINAAEAIAESCGNDVRQVLNALQMWAATEDKSGTRTSMTYRDLKEREKSINKDEILRVSLFDAARLLLEGRRGLSGADEKAALSHFMHRNDAFFVDYSFTGLLVQQNYLKVLQHPLNEAKRSQNNEKIEAVLDRMYKAAESMSDYAHAEHQLRSDQNWSVLPFVGAMVVKTGYHAGGETGGMFPGFPEFTTWLGRNSTKGKRMRLLSEMNHHMNYKISGGTTEMRLSYLPTLRSRFASLLAGREDGTNAAIELMDEYGLDRDDVLEKMDEFNIDPNQKALAQLLDSKKRAAFTKTYNAGSHKSQALVAEQGAAAAKKKKRSGGTGGPDLLSADLDAIDDDAPLAQEEEDDDDHDHDDDEMDPAKVAALFKGKGKAGKKQPATTKGKKTAPAKGRKK